MNRKPCKDHRGNQFISIKEMCNLYGITDAAYKSRIKHGWTVEEALTTPTTKTIQDHEGNCFNSIQEMCNYWGIERNTYKYRVYKLKMSTKQALTTPVQTTTCFDHTGKEFATAKEMCEYWGIADNAYVNRTATLGWSIEKALTTPVKTHDTVTFYNETFKTLSDLCKKYNITLKKYKTRIESGWSQEEALGLIPRIKPGSHNLKINDSLSILSPIKTDSDIQYYECKWNGNAAIMTRDIILDKARVSLAMNT